MEPIEARIRRALLSYASLWPLDLKGPGEIQADLRAIAGEPHGHRSSVDSDACLLCGQGRDEAVHNSNRALRSARRTNMSDQPKYRGYIIYYDPPPIPVRSMDWHYIHEDYDGASDGDDPRHGHCASAEECRQEIDEALEEGASLSQAETPCPNPNCNREPGKDTCSFGGCPIGGDF